MKLSLLSAGRRKGNPAPGPDGVSVSVWRSVSPSVLDSLAEIFSRCLRDGVFPKRWKRAKLVLIPKDGETVPGARPICLLDEIGKLFERIIVGRMKEYMERKPAARLSELQFGFREGLSTIDALDAAIAMITGATSKNGFAICASLDIKNAFNSLTWPSIRGALSESKFPPYLRRILDSYLSTRFIEFPTLNGVQVRPVTCGVPQGSVLGPLLWNVGYNSVVKKIHVAGSKVIGYADDTLVISTGKSVEQAHSRMNQVLHKVSRRIESLGLTVVPEKTEAVLFYGKRRPDLSPVIRLGGKYIRMSPRMKYLGIILDPKLRFTAHFKYTEEKMGKVNRSLGRLMPNLRGPSE